VRDLQNPATGGYVYATTNNAAGQYGIISLATSGWSGARYWENLAGHTTEATDDAYLAVNGSTEVGVFYSENFTLDINSDYEISLWGANAVTNQPALYPAEVGIRIINNASNTVIATASTGSMT